MHHDFVQEQILCKNNGMFMQPFLRVGVFLIPRYVSSMRLLALLLFIFCSVTHADWISAEDRIWLEPARPTVGQGDWYPRSIELLSGRIVALDAEQFRVIPQGQTAETVTSAARVLWVEPEQVSDFEKVMLGLFKEGKYAQSLSGLPNALKSRPPVWRQQWLTMLSANSAWMSGRAPVALELVGQLDRRPLPAMVLAWLPIAWENGAQPPAVVRAAKERSQDSSAAVRLVVASWLLSSADRNQGLQIINELVKDAGTPKDILQLARILSWRVTPPPQVAALRATWENEIAALPMALQTGPSRLLMDKLRASGQKEQAKRIQLSLELTPVYGLKQVLFKSLNQ